MLITILLLIFTVIVMPIVSFYFGTPLNTLQVEVLWSTAYIVAGIIAYCFVVGELTMNNSQVDKLWSIVPIVYVWNMTILGDMNERMVLMAILVSIWGSRLTFNFARRGAYTWRFWAGEEDYRWEELRKRPGFNNRIVWMIFNLFFICTYQNVLIFLFTLPILTSLGTNTAPLMWADYLLAALYVGFVVIEFIADQQQYDFQTEKSVVSTTICLWMNTRMDLFAQVYGPKYVTRTTLLSNQFGWCFICLALLPQVSGSIGRLLVVSC